VLLNEYVTPVPEVADSTKGTDLPSLMCMIRNCGRQIKDCVTDVTCKAGLDCLEGCAFNDQVCQVTAAAAAAALSFPLLTLELPVCCCAKFCLFVFSSLLIDFI